MDWRGLGRRALDVLVGLAAHLPAALVGEVTAIARRLAQIRVVGVAAEIAFFGALAVIPMTLAVVTLLGAFVGVQGEVIVISAVRQAASVALASEAREGVVESIQRLVLGPRPGIVSASIVFLLVFASRGMTAVMRGLALVYGTVDRRPWWHDRLVAVAFTLAAVVVVAGGLAAVVMVPLLDLLGLAGSSTIDTLASGVWEAARAAVLGLLAVLFLTVVYHDARGGTGRWLRDLPGALLATATAGVAVVGYRVVIALSPRALASSGEPDDIVGAVLLGTLATLVLLALVGGAVLLGAAFNAEHDPTVGT